MALKDAGWQLFPADQLHRAGTAVPGSRVTKCLCVLTVVNIGPEAALVAVDARARPRVSAIGFPPHADFLPTFFGRRQAICQFCLCFLRRPKTILEMAGMGHAQTLGPKTLFAVVTPLGSHIAVPL